MIRMIGVFSLAMFAMAQDQPASQKKTTAKKTVVAKAAAKTKATESAAAKTAVERLTIPPDAVAGPDGLYHQTDKNGKKWAYRQTPFGVSKTPEVPVEAVTAPAPKADPMAGVKVSVLGENVKFERTTPFGVSSWQKKMTELTAEEKTAVENLKAKQN